MMIAVGIAAERTTQIAVRGSDPPSAHRPRNRLSVLATTSARLVFIAAYQLCACLL